MPLLRKNWFRILIQIGVILLLFFASNLGLMGENENPTLILMGVCLEGLFFFLAFDICTSTWARVLWCVFGMPTGFIVVIGGLAAVWEASTDFWYAVMFDPSVSKVPIIEYFRYFWNIAICGAGFTGGMICFILYNKTRDYLDHPLWKMFIPYISISLGFVTWIIIELILTVLKWLFMALISSEAWLAILEIVGFIAFGWLMLKIYALHDGEECCHRDRDRECFLKWLCCESCDGDSVTWEENVDMGEDDFESWEREGLEQEYINKVELELSYFFHVNWEEIDVEAGRVKGYITYYQANYPKGTDQHTYPEIYAAREAEEVGNAVCKQINRIGMSSEYMRVAKNIKVQINYVVIPDNSI